MARVWGVVSVVNLFCVLQRYVKNFLRQNVFVGIVILVYKKRKKEQAGIVFGQFPPAFFAYISIIGPEDQF